MSDFDLFGPDSDEEIQQEPTNVSESLETKVDLSIMGKHLPSNLTAAASAYLKQRGEGNINKVGVQTPSKTNEMFLRHAGLASTTSPSLSSSNDEQPSKNNVLTLHHLPIHFHRYLNINNNMELGGSRGFTTLTNMKAGTCLLKEKAVVLYDSVRQTGGTFNLSSIENIYKNEDVIEAGKVLDSMQAIHPVKFEDIPQSVIPPIRESYKSQILNLLKDKTLNTRPKTEEEILLLILKFHSSAFGSGMFLYHSIFNHCLNSNCVKYVEENNGVSTVYLTRDVNVGEELTLNYFVPRESCWWLRREYMLEQHFFEINDCRKSEYGEYERFGSDKYPSKEGLILDSIGIENITELEKTLVELETHHKELLANYSSLKISKNTTTEEIYLRTVSEVATTVRDLAIASDDIVKKCPSIFNNPKHLLFHRARKLHVDIIHLLLNYGTLVAGVEIIDREVYDILLVDFLRESFKVLYLQIKYYGPDHPDVGGSYEDINEIISLVLSKNKKLLLLTAKKVMVENNEKDGDDDSEMENFGWEECVDFVRASKFEQNCRKEYLRIRRLYE